MVVFCGSRLSVPTHPDWSQRARRSAARDSSSSTPDWLFCCFAVVVLVALCCNRYRLLLSRVGSRGCWSCWSCWSCCAVGAVRWGFVNLPNDPTFRLCSKDKFAVARLANRGFTSRRSVLGLRCSGAFREQQIGLPAQQNGGSLDVKSKIDVIDMPVSAVQLEALTRAALKELQSGRRCRYQKNGNTEQTGQREGTLDRPSRG